MMKYTLIAMFALIAVASYVSAEVVAPLSLTEGASERRDLSGLADQSAEAQGGNVTALNIDALTITKSWQGYYGNISGEITLDDGSTNTFYNWTTTSVQGEVYGTRNSAVDFATTACASGAERTSEETFLGQTATDGDSVTNTFNTTDHPQFLVGSTTITSDSCFSTNAFSGGSLDTNRFHQILLTDSANTIYTTLIDSDQTAYDGAEADFQLLVGEDEHDGQEGPTTYFIWVELG